MEQNQNGFIVNFDHQAFERLPENTQMTIEQELKSAIQTLASKHPTLNLTVQPLNVHAGR
jgi:hypothetical protein